MIHFYSISSLKDSLLRKINYWKHINYRSCGHNNNNNNNNLNQVLLLGTEKSGKKTILNHINYLNLPLNLIALSNSIPITTYKNFLFDTKSIIIIIDSTKIFNNNNNNNINYLNFNKFLINYLININCEKLLIFINKIDLLKYNFNFSTTRFIENILNLKKINEIHSNLNWLILPCCGLKGYGIEEGMNWLLT